MHKISGREGRAPLSPPPTPVGLPLFRNKDKKIFNNSQKTRRKFFNN